MNLSETVLGIVSRFLPLLFTTGVVLVGLAALNRLLKRRFQDDPDAQFRFQLIMLALTFAGLLAVIIALPVDDTLRGQLLSLVGILLSAAIALSSTTFIGNVMAGIMLKVVKSARPGDFITVADLTGRIAEMGLLHTEIQTESRDLVTVPNLHMVTRPMLVVRASGTFISADVSLGYDVPHGRVAELLRAAAAKSGLSEGFVHVRELGDFAVTYRVAGLLEDVGSLISARSALREAMLDALHEGGVEIVSPNFMNTRALDDARPTIPEPTEPAAGRGWRQTEERSAEDVIFDKAEEAASMEKIRRAIEAADLELAALDEEGGAAAEEQRPAVEARKARLLEELKAAEERKKARELEEGQDGGG